VLAVEESGDAQASEPAKFSFGLEPRHRRLERRHPCARGLQEDVQLRVDAQFPADPPDERVPIRERVEVRERLPDAIRGRLDVDLRAEFLHAPT